MKICTFNVNSIRVRAGLILDWIRHRNDDLDVLCFQELKVVEELFPRDEFERSGFHCQVFGQKTYNGVAICTKGPLEDGQKGFGDAEWDEQKRFLSCRYKGIRIINVYAPHGDLKGMPKFEYKQGWYRRLIAHLNSHHSPKDPILIVGDFNVAREDRDVYNPIALKDSIGTLPEERAVFEELLDWGFVDTFRFKYPDSKQFTWWDYIGGAIWKDEGMRIDYALCTESLKKSVAGVEVDIWTRKRRQPKPSDHAPLIVTLDLG
ncbi:MAG: exodeoxyribonuclease III [Candidatus Aminicenantes bacterium]|nr:exodeoxyribonuclease III [Candidatus Aminicenantes bacterium]